MPDVIRLLPENVANQIAAGEVIQRPASVVKELVENSIDAGATQITVVTKDSGKTLIQVIDNGKGMSETDARMAFERHATSKIWDANDLFAIRTMGFRGEALASIAAVAEVTLQTRRDEDEIGTEITIRASEVISQEYIACPKGANFAVKNIFFNVPARRKFLKSDAYELRLMINEVQKVALAFPQIEFSFFHNDNELFHYYPVTVLKQRIGQVIGKSMPAMLVDLKSETLLGKIRGYIGKPEAARKTSYEQYFYVNNRYMRHPFFHKAILKAYEKILPAGEQPSYFIYFEVDPDKIDVNIHPTKTEIKFEDEQALWQILHSAARESLGRFNVLPSIDFDTEPAIPIPVFSKNDPIKIPTININPDYNPFQEDEKNSASKNMDNQHSWQNPYRSDSFDKENAGDKNIPHFSKANKNLSSWETLFSGFESDSAQPPRLFDENDEENKKDAPQPLNKFLNIKGRYIILPSRSGIMVIDQKRAHERILFDKYLKIYENAQVITQKSLFPELLELSENDYFLIQTYVEVINQLGFEIRCVEDQKIEVIGYPAFLDNVNINQLINDLLIILNENFSMGKAVSSLHETVALALSKSAAIPYGKELNEQEMQFMVDQLFACSNHQYSPSGKLIMAIIPLSEIESKLE